MWMEPGKEMQPAAWVGWLAENHVSTFLPGLREQLPRHRHDMLIGPMWPLQTTFKQFDSTMIET